MEFFNNVGRFFWKVEVVHFIANYSLHNLKSQLFFRQLHQNSKIYLFKSCISSTSKDNKKVPNNQDKIINPNISIKSFYQQKNRDTKLCTRYLLLLYYKIYLYLRNPREKIIRQEKNSKQPRIQKLDAEQQGTPRISKSLRFPFVL